MNKYSSNIGLSYLLKKQLNFSLLFVNITMKKVLFQCRFKCRKRSNFFVLQWKIIPHICSLVSKCVFIIICPIEFFVKQSCISCVIIVNIFVRQKIIGKDFRKIMQMKLYDK